MDCVLILQKHTENIISIDYSRAEALEGVEKIFTYKDIVGENQIGGIIPDEPLWAEDEVHFWGQPIAFIVAETEAIAKKARALIEIEIEELPVITTAIQAKEKGSFINAPRSFNLGNTTTSFSECEYVIEGETFSNGTRTFISRNARLLCCASRKWKYKNHFFYARTNASTKNCS